MGNLCSKCSRSSRESVTSLQRSERQNPHELITLLSKGRETRKASVTIHRDSEDKSAKVKTIPERTASPNNSHNSHNSHRETKYENFT